MAARSVEVKRALIDRRCITSIGRASAAVLLRYNRATAMILRCLRPAVCCNCGMAVVAHAAKVTQNRPTEPVVAAPLPSLVGHPALARSLQRAYSAERAASFAYIGHAGSLRDPAAKAAVKQIEEDEWAHRRHVFAIMEQYHVPVSRSLEWRYYVVGKVIAGSCHVIGWFMPYFFAGKLESGNVCEYFVMMRYFHELGIRDHDAILHEMGMKEKDHEVYFLAQIEKSRWLPAFEGIFSWGRNRSLNDVDLEHAYDPEDSHRYCADHPAAKRGRIPENSKTAGGKNLSTTTHSPECALCKNQHSSDPD